MQLNELKKICVAALAAGWFTAASAQGVQSSNPNEFIKSAVETVVKASKTDPGAKDGDVGAMTKVVQREFLPYTNFERTTQLAVGQAWKTATPDQQKRLVQLFTDLLVHTYALQLTQIHDQSVAFSFQPAKVNAGGTDGVVRTEVKGTGSGDDLQVGYRVAKTPAGWRIYDIDMMGVWLIQLYQRQFGDQLAKNGVDGLIKYLADHNARFQK
jgi:ABC-type transporter MlaC component